MKPAVGDPKRNTLYRIILRLTGFAILLLSLVYVLREVNQNWAEITKFEPNGTEIAELAGLSIFYGITLFLLAESWHQIVGVFGPETRRRTWRSYTLTQVARYLPGNIAHLLGRAAVLRDGPLSVRQLGLATFLELIVVPSGAIAALLLAAILTPGVSEFASAFGWHLPAKPILTAAVVVPVMAGLCFVFQRIGLKSKFMFPLFAAFLLSTLFMFALGTIFGAVVLSVGNGPFWFASVAGVCAWLVGYLTPGAPGGLGSREATLVWTLSDTMPVGELIIAVAMFRIVTVSGDALCFAAGAVLLRGQTISGR